MGQHIKQAAIRSLVPLCPEQRRLSLSRTSGGTENCRPVGLGSYVLERANLMLQDYEVLQFRDRFGFKVGASEMVGGYRQPPNQRGVKPLREVDGAALPTPAGAPIQPCRLQRKRRKLERRARQFTFPPSLAYLGPLFRQ